MPRSSVTATNLLPVSVCIAVTVTPGSTPPLESEMVPVTVASCANTDAGTASAPAITTRRNSVLQLLMIDSPSENLPTRHADVPEVLRVEEQTMRHARLSRSTGTNTLCVRDLSDDDTWIAATFARTRLSNAREKGF